MKKDYFVLAIVIGYVLTLGQTETSLFAASAIITLLMSKVMHVKVKEK